MKHRLLQEQQRLGLSDGHIGVLQRPVHVPKVAAHFQPTPEPKHAPKGGRVDDENEEPDKKLDMKIQ